MRYVDEAGAVRWVPLRWHWWDVRCVWRHFWREAVPLRIAWLLPKRVALLAFIRVYSVIGRVGPDFDVVCNEWRLKYPDA